MVVPTQSQPQVPELAEGHAHMEFVTREDNLSAMAVTSLTPASIIIGTPGSQHNQIESNPETVVVRDQQDEKLTVYHESGKEKLPQNVPERQESPYANEKGTQVVHLSQQAFVYRSPSFDSIFATGSEEPLILPSTAPHQMRQQQDFGEVLPPYTKK
ncbi:hypothetical protein HDU97_005766 [Phlyctochytrium planicorne]|nr:hypothetical protein HDU97_005766 [Phlyctochytrium planicorne]